MPDTVDAPFHIAYPKQDSEQIPTITPLRWVNLLTNPTGFDTPDSQSFVNCYLSSPPSETLLPARSPLLIRQIIAFATITATLFSHFFSSYFIEAEKCLRFKKNLVGNELKLTASAGRVLYGQKIKTVVGQDR